MDIPSTLIDIAFKSIPSVAIMISGILSIWLSRGAWAKHDEKKQKFLLNAGIIAFSLGLLLTALVAVLQIWRDYSTYLITFWASIWTMISPIVSWRTTLYLVLTLIWLLCFRWLRMLRAERGYKIQVDGVIRTGGDYPEANILVENIGKGSFYCLARLVRVQVKKGVWEDVDVKEINPDGDFLVWNGNQAQPKLVENVPQAIGLINVSNNKTCFRYYGGQRYPKSPPLDNGIYKIEIDFFRIRKGKQIRILSFNNELTIATKYGKVVLSWKK